MYKFFKYIRELFGFGETENRNLLTNDNKKRRYFHDENEYTKRRKSRLNDVHGCDIFHNDDNSHYSSRKHFVELNYSKTNKSNETIQNHFAFESVNTKNKIEPVHSQKTILDVETFVKPNFFSKFDQTCIQRKKEFENKINEKRTECSIVHNDNQKNINLLLNVKDENYNIFSRTTLEGDKITFPKLTPKQEDKINAALKSENANEVFAVKYNLRISGYDLKTFNDNEWLNDEVINFYLNLIHERSQQKMFPKVYSFSTFFYPKLKSEGYSSLKRWTKSVDIFAYDIIIVPVHLGFHWCMAIIDFRDKSIRYYDSMLRKNMPCLNALENYLREEHKDKNNSEYDTSNWSKVIMEDIPRQMNGTDCGVFSCTFAEFITRNAKILFTQEHIPYIRRKMVIEIIEGRLLT